MKSSNLLSNISNEYLLKGIISYFPEKDEKKILNIFKYNKKFQNKLNISLYNYQKEFLNLTFNGINPSEIEIDSLYDDFKDIFDNKEIFIKIIDELFPEEEDDTIIFSEIENNFKFTKIKEIIDFNKIENLTSLEFYNIKNLELGQMNARIKNLKISGGGMEK
jgi:ribosomal 30S subunit maturation factor RimM